IRFVAWVTLTHTQRWHAHRRSTGAGHLYQGRYKSFPVQGDEHFLSVCRYVERNALRAGLVGRAEEWPWSSLWRRASPRPTATTRLARSPIERPEHWLEWVNQPQSATELDSLRDSVQRGRPYGTNGWVHSTVDAFRLHSTLRRPGRPKTSLRNGS